MLQAFLAAVFTVSIYALPAEKDSLVSVLNGCEAFKTKLKIQRPDVLTGIAQVPKYWNDPANKETLPVFWWKRPGKDNTYPALVYIHGGPASYSWGMLDRWSVILDHYPGDVISFDHRGEGCSKTIRSSLDPKLYEVYRIRNIVRDMEFLRENVFGLKTWRVHGHSRGGAMVHYYLEMAPQSLESAHATGFTILPDDFQKNYAYNRARGNALVAEEYLKRYPGDDVLVAKIRKTVSDNNMCWRGLDNRHICGASAVDVLGAIYIKNPSSWAAMHGVIVKMSADGAPLYSMMEAEILKDLNAHFNYIMATNTVDLGAPDSHTSEYLRRSADPIYVKPFVAELRYVTEALASTTSIDWKGDIDLLDYKRVKLFLDGHPNFRFALYAGAYDPIALPEYYKPSLDYLNGRAKFTVLNDSGHDGWFDPIVIAELMRRNY